MSTVRPQNLDILESPPAYGRHMYVVPKHAVVASSAVHEVVERRPVRGVLDGVDVGVQAARDDEAVPVAVVAGGPVPLHRHLAGLIPRIGC